MSDIQSQQSQQSQQTKKNVKKVRFAKNVMVYDPNGWQLWGLSSGVVAAISVILVIFFVIWIIGLVRMGSCNGTKSPWFWLTLFLFLFIPGLGQLFGVSMALAAIILLRGPNGKMLDMHC